MSEHIPRADRPSRARAVAALTAYLEEHRDIRIGQAIVNASGAVDAFNLEDDELASTLEQATRRRAGQMPSAAPRNIATEAADAIRRRCPRGGPGGSDLPDWAASIVDWLDTEAKAGPSSGLTWVVFDDAGTPIHCESAEPEATAWVQREAPLGLYEIVGPFTSKAQAKT